MFRLILKARERELVKKHEERMSVIELRGARAGLDALEAAARRGHEVDAAIEKQRREIEAIRGRVPRGERGYLLALAVTTAAASAFLLIVYPRLVQNILNVWGSMDHEYILQYKASPVALVKAGRALTASVWPLLISAPLFILNVYLMQMRLRRSHAKTFQAGLILLVILAVGILTAAAVTLTFHNPV
jgi:hypothetical protein